MNLYFGWCSCCIANLRKACQMPELDIFNIFFKFNLIAEFHINYKIWICLTTNWIYIKKRSRLILYLFIFEKFKKSKNWNMQFYSTHSAVSHAKVGQQTMMKTQKCHTNNIARILDGLLWPFLTGEKKLWRFKDKK